MTKNELEATQVFYSVFSGLCKNTVWVYFRQTLFYASFLMQNCFISKCKNTFVFVLDSWIYLITVLFTSNIKQKISFNWQDANAIKKIFNMKKAEIEHSELAKSSLRIRYCK